jgi:hypothetical protein
MTRAIVVTSLLLTVPWSGCAVHTQNLPTEHESQKSDETSHTVESFPASELAETPPWLQTTWEDRHPLLSNLGQATGWGLLGLGAGAAFLATWVAYGYAKQGHL